MSSNANWAPLARIERLGELLIKLHVQKLSQLTQLLEKQQHQPQKKLGELAIEQGMIAVDELRYFLAQLEQDPHHPTCAKELAPLTDDDKWQWLLQHEHLGELLIQRQTQRLMQLMETIQVQRQHPGQPLGQMLVEKELVTKGEMESLLASHYQQFKTLTRTVGEITEQLG